MEIKKLQFQRHGDMRGQLVALEYQYEIPFVIKRVYYMFDTKQGIRRGFHAHKNLEQILICVSGSCKIHLDDGIDTAEVILDSPTEGLYIGSNYWREMYEFSENAVLLVLASELYNEDDYIRDYGEFKEYTLRKCDEK